MKEYYFNDGTGQHGPFTLEELKGKNITASTPIWYDPLPKWTTAGEVEELKDIIVHTPPPFENFTPTVIETKEEVKPALVVETPVAASSATATITTTTTPVATAATTTVAAKPVRKKSTAWLSWVLSLLVLGGTGYYIYQDMEKNKTPGAGIAQTDSTTNNITDSITDQSVNQTTPADTTTSPTTMTGTITDTSTSKAITTETTPPPTTTTVDNKTTKAQQLQAKKKAEEEKKKKAAAEKKKQEAAQAALTKQKADQEKQRLVAAQATLAKEMQMRNSWPDYVTFGKLDYKVSDDGISAFDVPVYNATDAVLDKVTVRVDYLKKESKSKVFKSETIVIYNIQPKSGMNARAPEYKKGKSVKAYIISIVSRKLHFCYPQNNGNSADPYYCN